jgi:16S rRNA processing protein RimM
LDGCRVETVEGEVLGVFKDVIATRANDIFVVQGTKEYLIPALKTVVLEINLTERVIKVQLPPGLRDIYES